MKKILFSLFFGVSLSSCVKQEKADLVIHNGAIFTFNEEEKIHDALAVSDGKVIEVGPEHYIMNKYLANEYLDLKKKVLLPQLIDPTIKNVRSSFSINLFNTDSSIFIKELKSLESESINFYDSSLFGFYLGNSFNVDSTSYGKELFYGFLSNCFSANKVLSIEAKLINIHPFIFESICTTLKGYNDQRWNIRNAHLMDSAKITKMVDVNLIPIIPDSIYTNPKFSKKVDFIRRINGIICVSDFSKNLKGAYGTTEELKMKSRLNAISLKIEKMYGKIEPGYYANFNIYGQTPFQESLKEKGTIKSYRKGKVEN